MSNTVLAAQMYTLREFTKTPVDIAQTMKKVKAIGYDAVQLSALGPIDPKELKKILAGEGLIAASTHVAFDKLGDDDLDPRPCGPDRQADGRGGLRLAVSGINLNVSPNEIHLVNV